MALPIVMQKVNSQMLSEMGYLRAANTLFVKFRNNGAVYAYFGVPSEHWQRLRAVASIGRYMQRHIFKKYAAARISEGEKAVSSTASAEAA
ncbi:hypothetical protein GGR28_002999 [Lewinella aquimaris]|uniref:KTSC domain-containing protein n=1 Tax=Neolewinella aquimaris TaxID=1835722 RepID=A0A840E9Y6_9BACT|nr:KTSC domain-containing protein [Neolewinella aquimaris]MBB4080365.1 hypothetical protein [Neolewinella aquimaris]